MKNKFIHLYHLTETMTVFADLKEDKVLGNLCKLVEILSKRDFKEQIYPEALNYYTSMCTELYKANMTASLPNYIYDLILYAENAFSVKCAQNQFHEISTHVVDAAKKAVSLRCPAGFFHAGSLRRRHRHQLDFTF